MSSDEEKETPWVRVAFDVKFLRSDYDFDDADHRDLLIGLGRAIAFLLLPTDQYQGTGVYVRNLDIHETDFLSDEDLKFAVEQFTQDEGEEP